MATVLLTAIPHVTRFAGVLLSIGVFAQLTKMVKLGGFAVDPSVTRAEAVGLCVAAMIIAGAGTSGSSLASVAVVIAAAAMVAGLWLDSVLFRVFTIELGPGGIGDVIVSVLYRELAELAHARRFFAAHKTFAWVPLATGLAIVDGAFALRSSLHLTAMGIVAAGLLVAALSISGRGSARAWAFAGLLAITVAVEALGGAALGLAAAGCAIVGFFACARRTSANESTPAGLAHFLMARRVVDDPGFVPRPEHAPLIARPTLSAHQSSSHGALRGADVVLLTFESVGRDHLAAHARDGAVTPFFDGLFARGVTSGHHFCISPTTNNAHVAIHCSGYSARVGGVAALGRMGYRTAYLTTARTSEYGLRSVLERAGFSTIIDRESLAHGDSDYALVDEGVASLERLRRGDRPLFLHVHATHTHVPYRVVDQARFARFDARQDGGRFRNGIEETDHIFGQLLERLVARGIVRDPLVIATSDHGQAFGALGYQSHGSAIVADEILVPFVLAHPRIAPRRVDASSHFDVLPTVLDLVGAPAVDPGFGESLLSEIRSPRPCWLLWAGHPSRTTTTHCGVVLGGQKLMLDLVLDRCLRMDWNDREIVAIEGDEKAYVSALLGRVMALRGVQ